MALAVPAASQVQVGIDMGPQHTDVWQRAVLLVKVQSKANHKLVRALRGGGGMEANIHNQNTFSMRAWTITRRHASGIRQGLSQPNMFKIKEQVLPPQKVRGRRFYSSPLL